MNENDKTLELWSTLQEVNASVINDVVKHVRDNYELNDDDTLAVEFNVIKSGSDSDLNATQIDKEDEKLGLAATEQNYHCKECNLRYRHRHNYEAHMNAHRSKSKDSEDIEGKSSLDLPPDVDPTVKKSLKRKKKRPATILYCELCNKQLASRRSLENHMRNVHEGLRQHMCDICGKCFADRFTVIAHRRIHTGEKPYTCHVCNKTFRTNGILYYHLKTHSNDRPYACSFCNKTYKYSNMLKRHRTVHTGEKKFSCNTCGKRFSRSVGVKKHMLIHTGLKPYQCHICHSMFNQRRYLKQHLLGKHRLHRTTVLSIVRNVKAQTQSGPVVSKSESESETTVYKTEDAIVNKTEQALQVLENCGDQSKENEQHQYVE